MRATPYLRIMIIGNYSPIYEQEENLDKYPAISIEYIRLSVPLSDYRALFEYLSRELFSSEIRVFIRGWFSC
jgi:hypothetical protein